VKIVSRCIAARNFGIAATITRPAAPCLNNAPWREVRSLMPIRTTPSAIGITSPPSPVASPWSRVGSLDQNFTRPATSGWNSWIDAVRIVSSCRASQYSGLSVTPP
jgi:hypothetical protein